MSLYRKQAIKNLQKSNEDLTKHIKVLEKKDKEESDKETNFLNKKTKQQTQATNEKYEKNYEEIERKNVIFQFSTYETILDKNES